MAKNIEPTLKLISQYLKLDKNENFLIPEYQRGYSWDIQQCDKLWQDIEAFISSEAGDPYFFGTIIVDCSEINTFSLIDGQQRTTTFLLLLKALLLRINHVLQNTPSDDDSEGLKAGLIANRNKIMSLLFKADPEEIPAMLKEPEKTQNIVILENKSINEAHHQVVQTIIEASSFPTAEQNVFKIPRRQKDNKYTNHFRNFKFFYTKLDEKSDTQLNLFAKIFLEKCQVIEIRSWQIEQAITMFNSLNSTGLPLADADIISAQMYSKAGADKKAFNEQWERIKRLAEDLDYCKIINIDGILQQFMYINRALNKEYIKDKSVDVTLPGLRRYYTDIRKDLLSEPLLLCNNLEKITNHWCKIKEYPGVKLLLKCNENAKLYLCSYIYRFDNDEITEKIINKICDCLLRLFTIVELVDAGYSSAKFKTFLFRENIKIVDKAIPMDEIIKDFNDHIYSNWDETTLSKAILENEKKLLVYLNEYVYAKKNGYNFHFPENTNIEHIMPASGRNITSIREDAGITDENNFAHVVNELGNKILLEEDINKSIGNEWFKTKKQSSIIHKSGYKDSKFAIAESLTRYPSDSWTIDDITEATQKAVNRLVGFILARDEYETTYPPKI